MTMQSEVATDRRRFWRLVALAVLNSPACWNVAVAADDPAPSRPNIVLIMADDMGWSDAGCYGGEIRTPGIDAIAAGGLRFTRFYNNSLCGPTRVSLLTGLYCQQVGHRGHQWNDPVDFNKCVTIAELLQHAGYHTMMVGKWQGRDLAVRRGFDRFFGPMCRNMISYFNAVRENPFYLDDKPWEIPAQGFYMTDAFSDYAVEFLKEAATKRQPFFLYVAPIAPHWPLHAREADIAPYRETYRQAGWDQHRARRFERQRAMGLVPDAWPLSPAPDLVPDWNEELHKDWQAERMAVYAGQITCMDRGIGRILDEIRAAGVEENTLVMFLSDNGATLAGGAGPTTTGFAVATEDNTWRLDGVQVRAGSGPQLMPGPHDTFAAYGPAWANTSNTPFRGYKTGDYEGGIITPLVVRWPRVIKQKNQLTRQPGHVIDLMATCLDAGDVSYPAHFRGRRPLPLEGKSLMPIFRGQNREEHAELCWSTAPARAIRVGPWKLVSPARDAPWELYDMEADGTETKDLAERFPDRVKDMAARFAAWRVRVGMP